MPAGSASVMEEAVSMLELFGSSGHCTGCSKPIPAFEMVMRARENVYHLECFACRRCNQRGFVMLNGSTYWTDLFTRHFLMEEDRTAQESDDLLFFIRKRHLKEAKKQSPKYETLLEVQRRDSKKLPIGDPEIDWEETIYANLIIHRFDYYVTLAVCTRTSPKELQVLRRHTERVWASPSRRLMSDKGTSEEITYPNICFMLDNFDEAFTDIVVRDGEMVSVELVARDRTAALQCVIFLGSVRYDALRRVYDARTSLTTRMAQRMTFGLYSGADAQRMEFVRVRGPMGKGHAELAVTKPADVECLSPTASEPGCSLTDQLGGAEAREYYQHTQRRASDPSGNFHHLMKANLRVKSPCAGPGACSVELGPELAKDSVTEIEAGDPRAGMKLPVAKSIDSISQKVAAAGANQLRVASTKQISGRATDEEDDSSRTLTGTSSSGNTPLSPETGERLTLEHGTKTSDAVPTVTASSSPTVTAVAPSVTMPAASARAGFVRRSSCSDSARSRPSARHPIVTPGMLYRRACGQDGAASAAAAGRCQCARTPDGTVVHYRCHVQQAFLRQRAYAEDRPVP
ncbi:uncharacterized protein FJT64_010268 [Amphibalanus amphitrite]|uniref:LIM zinc-binding domain-containing protein n=1 Tax=Amphibalanus amphitrite TaxID=1232801 RepID=A0A6A4VDJ2_AMPAM|nr:uncharacterized protein FJT64_010268 [Amphibalanus amphitrite]